MTCEQCQELLLLYVTGALEPGEETAVRAHLAKGCPACAAELAANEATVHQLPLALAAKPAPASAWDKIETRIALEEPNRTRSVSEGRESDLNDSFSAISGDRSVLAAPFTPKPKSWAWTGWAAAAAIALFLGLALFNSEQKRTNNEARIAALLYDMDLARKASADGIKGAYDQISKLQLQILALSQPAQYFVSSPEQPAASGVALWDKTANTLTMKVQNAKRLEAGKTYELWIVTADNNKIAAGTANVDVPGGLTFHTNLPAGTIITAAAITDEKEAGEPNNGAQGKVQFLAVLANAP